MMLLSAHQPVYLPWLGLFHKVAVADLFVIFDDVPYSRKMWYNRNKILGPNGPILLSVPVSAGEATKHKDVRIDNDKNWSAKHWRSIELTYKKTRYFNDYAGTLADIYATEWEHLNVLNEALLRQMMKWLAIDTPLVRASDYSFKGQKSALVLDMCLQLGAQAYLFGALGKDYADIDAFIAAGVAPLFQTYRHPVYEQRPRQEFVANMCALDLLFRYGPESAAMLRAGNPDRGRYVAEAQQLLAPVGA